MDGAAEVGGRHPAIATRTSRVHGVADRLLKKMKSKGKKMKRKQNAEGNFCARERSSNVGKRKNDWLRRKPRLPRRDLDPRTKKNRRNIRQTRKKMIFRNPCS